MELNEKQIEMVGEYIQGNLKDDDLATFLQNIEENPLLQEELRIQQAIQDGIEHRNNLKLRTRFKEISEETKHPKKETKIFSLKFIRMVASVAAIMLVCFAAYTLMNQTSDVESIYASYFEPSDLTSTRSSDISEVEASAKRLYIEKKYDKALPLLNEALAINPSSNLRLAYGSALLKCNKLEEARTQFTSIIEANDPLYIDQAKWYMGLLELNNGDLGSAKTFLNQLIGDSNSDYHSEAVALLKELDKLQ